MPAFSSLRPSFLHLVSAGLVMTALLIAVPGCGSKPSSSETETAEATASRPATESTAPSSADEEAPALPAPDFSDEKPEITRTAGEDAAEPAEVPPGSDPLVDASLKRPTTEGWWRIIFAVDDSDFSAGFVQIAKDGSGGYAVKELRTNDIINPAKAVETAATDKTVAITFAHEDNKFDYAGTLADNVIRGNLQFQSRRQNLVRLIPVKESDVTDEALDEQKVGQTFGFDPIVTALQSEQAVSNLQSVSETWRRSPVLYFAYDALFSQAKALELDRPSLETLSGEFETTGRVWGERAEQAAKLNIAVSLLLAAHDIEFAQQKLAEVRKDAPELVELWSDLLVPAERIAEVESAWRLVVDGKAEQGLEALRRLNAARPIEPRAAYRLATAEQKHGSQDEALRLFSRLAVLPQTEIELAAIPQEVEYVPPRSAAAKLYEAKHGNRDGFDEYLGQVYQEALTSFIPEEAKNRQPTESPRIALVELFTGATCPPCVAADVATEAVERTFPGTDVVVLRYHLNIPGPDPLANSDTEARRDYYGTEEIPGTPAILIDGAKVPFNIGGIYSSAPEIYEELSGAIAEAAAKPAGATIELTASAEGNALHLAAKATGVEGPTDAMRLRLAIVESQIGYLAPNGIREHEMVVREMPGGAAGIAAVDGGFSFEQDVPLTEVRDRLVTYLNQSEANISRESDQPFSFPVRPLDLRRLKVVAFLQNDETHEILQAAIVPIEQEFELPKLASRANAASPAGNGDAATDGPAIVPQE